METTKVMRKTISASRALAQLNGALTNLPNPRLFLDTIHLQEAKASSEIENIITTNEELYKYVIADKKFENPTTKEVICYKEALWHGLEQLESKPFITTNLCIEVMQRIKQNTSSIRTTLRTTLSNAKGEIMYTPPSGELVIRDKLRYLEQFINEDNSLDPLIKLALLHYQFEAIHPFPDGNGRTGRILLLLYLKIEKLLDIPAIYLSEYIINNKVEYYKRLRQVTESENWESWILYILDMIEWTSKKGIKRLEDILNSMKTVSEDIQKELPKAYSKDLIEILYKLPYTKRQHLIDAGLGTAKTVGNYLIALEEKGFLKSVKLGKEKLYLNHRLMSILEKK
ncbi:Fic family protein [Flavobacteriaceae bacterium LMO-SS05]